MFALLAWCRTKVLNDAAPLLAQVVFERVAKAFPLKALAIRLTFHAKERQAEAASLTCHSLLYSVIDRYAANSVNASKKIFHAFLSLLLRSEKNKYMLKQI
jgi:hypothetical protein